MGFVKATEAKKPTFIKCLFYGKAGVGKTTLALSAPKPAVIDFDGGIHRVNYQHAYGVDVLQPSGWLEVMEALADVEAMKDYQTIVVDTIDKMMDFIITYKCGTKQPSIKDWTGINSEFNRFCRAIDNLKKNVIFLSHEVSVSEKDVICYRPALRDKNFVAVQNELDVLGFLQRTEIQGTAQRTLTFFATNCEGKKPSNFPDMMIVPANLDNTGKKVKENDFFATSILGKYMEMKAKDQEAMQAYSALMEEIKTDIDKVMDADTANDFVKNVLAYKHVGNSKEIMKQLFAQKVKNLGLTLNDKKQYVAA